jgi:regulator of sigma E protease
VLLAVGLLIALSWIPGLGRAVLARLCGVRVVRVMLGCGPRLGTFGARTRWQLHAIPIGVFSQVAGLHATDEARAPDAPDALGGRGALVQLVVLFGGAIGVAACAVTVSMVTHVVGGELVVDDSIALVDNVLPERPAARAGIRDGDIIVAIDGARVERGPAVAELLQRGHGPARIEVRRDGVPLTMTVDPDVDAGTRRIGIQIATGQRIEHPPLGRTLLDGATYPARYARFVLGVMGAQFIGAQAVVIGGPVGLVRQTARNARSSGAYGVAMMSVILSTTLALWLLMPFRPADGGRALVWVLRRLRRAPTPTPTTNTLARPTSARGAAMVALLVVVALLAIATLAAGLGVALACAFVALGRRRAWGWALVHAVTPLLAASCMLSAIVGHSTANGAYAATVAALSVAALLLTRSTHVRESFSLRCGTCQRLDGRPVVGAVDTFGCLSCGSTWTWATARPASSA